jgi:hypothetical protein
MKWNRYSGIRIVTNGWRTSVEIPAKQAYAPTTRRYGCVWEDNTGIHGYYEVDTSGEIDDVEIGPFASLKDARRAIEIALSKQYPNAW